MMKRFGTWFWSPGPPNGVFLSIALSFLACALATGGMNRSIAGWQRLANEWRAAAYKMEKVIEMQREVIRDAARHLSTGGECR